MRYQVMNGWRPSLGQGYVTTLTWDQTQQWYQEFKAGLEKHPECANRVAQYVIGYVDGVREGRLPQEGLPMLQADLDEYKGFKACVEKLAPAPSAPASASASPVPDVPTWAWIAGSVAVAGMIAYVATR